MSLAYSWPTLILSYYWDALCYPGKIVAKKWEEREKERNRVRVRKGKRERKKNRRIEPTACENTCNER